MIPFRSRKTIDHALAGGKKRIFLIYEEINVNCIWIKFLLILLIICIKPVYHNNLYHKRCQMYYMMSLNNERMSYTDCASLLRHLLIFSFERYKFLVFLRILYFSSSFRHDVNYLRYEDVVK